MKKSFAAFLFGVLFFNVSAQDTFPFQVKVKTILFLGNSITYDGRYINYLELYLKTKFPSHDLVFINQGLPSETVSGLSEPNHAGGAFPRPDLHERFSRLIKNIHPDLVFICYGMNDGILKPFDLGRFKKYTEGINWLYKSLQATGAGIMVLTPPIIDPKKNESYANVLDIYSDWLISKKYTDQWKVIDLHFPMKNYLFGMRKNDSAYYLAKDGIHPNDTGHWLMCKSILQDLGVDSLDSVYSINDAMKNYTNYRVVLTHISKKQNIMRDAYLTHIGHRRPGLAKGLPLPEAGREIELIQKEIALFFKGE